MTSGTQIGNYRLLQQIGEGGMGAVWLAEHVLLGRRAALKLLHPAFTSQPEVVARFFNEARAATTIADAGIVQVFDFGYEAGRAYIVMELLDGEPLDRRLRRVGALAIGDALRVMRQVATSLGAAHARGIVHRDLKPENVFLVRDGEVAGGERAKILDFGIAKLTWDQAVKTQSSAVMGTPMYMSPEQCRGAGKVDQRSDIYSLGCMLFAVIAGRPPFDAEGAGEIIAMHLREPAPPLSHWVAGVPAEVEQLVLRCMAKDPDQRPGSGSELAVAISELACLPHDGWTPSAIPPQLTPATPTAATTLSSASGAAPAPARRISHRALLGVTLACAATAAIAVAFAIAMRAAPVGEPAPDRAARLAGPDADAPLAAGPPHVASPPAAPPADAPVASAPAPADAARDLELDPQPVPRKPRRPVRPRPEPAPATPRSTARTEVARPAVGAETAPPAAASTAPAAPSTAAPPAAPSTAAPPAPPPAAPPTAAPPPAAPPSRRRWVGDQPAGDVDALIQRCENAARLGHCSVVVTTASAIKKKDPAAYARWVATNPVIAKCLN